jgi:hypothetical protein
MNIELLLIKLLVYGFIGVVGALIVYIIAMASILNKNADRIK